MHINSYFAVAGAFLLALACAAQGPVTQTSNTNETLRGLSVPSAAVAWASGTHGTFLRTTDTGKSWTVAQVPGAETLDFRDVEAFNDQVAYLLAAGPGEQSRIYRTNDGGRNWTLQFTNHDPQGFLDCMAFWDQNHGMTLGDPVGGKFTLLTTRDGGKHWKPTADPPSAVMDEGAFAASGTCLTVGRGGQVWFVTGGAASRVFHSTNRGKSWSVAETPLPHTNPSSGIFSIAFGDRRNGVIAGGDYKSPDQGSSNLAYTRDGGKSWVVSPIAPQAYFSGVALFVKSPDTAKVFAVGSKGSWLSDGPQKKGWKSTWPFNVSAVAFDSHGNAFAVGAKGMIVYFPLSQ